MIILIGGEKGGTGKTTVATNLSACLASAGRDVLLVDADRQGTSR
jgi:chromosome partitioning protein